VTRAELWPQTVLTPLGLRILWRVVEEGTSRPVDCWLPGLENPDPEGDLDRGGFDSKVDAEAFRLGVDWIRAEAGMLPGMTTADIDAERTRLDGNRPLPELDTLDLDDATPSPRRAPSRPEPVYSYLGPSLAF